MIKEAIKYSILTSITICMLFLIIAIFYWNSPSLQKGLMNFLGEKYILIEFSMNTLVTFLIMLCFIMPFLAGIIFVAFIAMCKEEKEEDNYESN